MKYRSRPKTIDNVLEPEEIEELLSKMQCYREELVVKGLLYTGMRVSEFIHMKVDWIDFKRGVIKIPPEMRCSCKQCSVPSIKKNGKIGRPVGIWRPKTSQGARIIPIVAEIRPLLKSHFANLDNIIDSIPSRGSAHYHLKKVAERTSIKHKVFPHSLRGTFASLLAKMNFSMIEIKEAMGWKDITPASKYIRLFGDQLVKSFDEKWKGVKQ